MRLAIEVDPEKHIPLRLFGDDTGTLKNKALRVLFWNSVCAVMKSRLSRTPIYLAQAKELITENDLSEWECQEGTAWSFNCGGTMPHVDWNGEDVTGWRAEIA